MDPGITAALAIGVTGYVVVLFPAAAGHERLIAVAGIWALALLAMAGLRLSSRSLNALTALKLAALVAVVAGAFTVPSGSWAHFWPPFARAAHSPPLFEALGVGLIGAFYSFGGFWEASRVAGEVRDARRLLPRALTLGVIVVTAAYVAVTAAFLYLAPPSGRGSVVAFAGVPLRMATAAVVISVAASILALLLMAPRLYLAMSADGLFPEALARVNPRTGAPVRATVLLAVIASVFVLTGSFSEIVALFMCTTLLFVGLAAAGLFVVRSRPAAGAQPGFLAPGYPATTALFVLLVSGVVVSIALARPLPALAGFALMLTGLPVYALRRGTASGVAA
jgi:APA family basic amino acid/polyamine antiporter